MLLCPLTFQLDTKNKKVFIITLFIPAKEKGR